MILETMEKLQQENAKLKEQRSKAIEYCDEKLKYNRYNVNDYWTGKNNVQQKVSIEIKEILESGNK